jgi:DNA invertase Pin-like site-specific DNA recombinase
MSALKPNPSFQALIMSEESRLGREAIETAYALKQLVTVGVRVFFYLEDRKTDARDSPTDKVMLSLTAFADELERENARQRTYDAMLRNARAGHVTGGALFGYHNVEILGPDGKRSHVERRVTGTEVHVNGQRVLAQSVLPGEVDGSPGMHVASGGDVVVAGFAVEGAAALLKR